MMSRELWHATLFGAVLGALVVVIAMFAVQTIKKWRMRAAQQRIAADVRESSSEEDDVVGGDSAPPKTYTQEEVAAIMERVQKLVSIHCTSPPVASDTVPLSVREYEALILDPESPLTFAKFYTQNGETADMNQGDWDASDPIPGKHRLTLRKKIPFVGPFKKWANLTVDIRCLETLRGGGDACILVSRTEVSGVPYSDYFIAYMVIVCMPTTVPYTSKYESYIGIDFVKITSLQSLILTQSDAETKAAHQLWLQLAGPHMTALVSRRRIRRSPRGAAERKDSEDSGDKPSQKLCPCCEPSCKLGGHCKKCLRVYKDSLAFPSPAPDARPFYTPCTSIGGCSACGCAPLCQSCGCRCSLCAKFGPGAACQTFGCAKCKCKPVCATCGCACGLCGNKGSLAACRTVGCAACKCSPSWTPWGRKFTAPKTVEHAHNAESAHDKEE
jgi:hypothetical protein